MRNEGKKCGIKAKNGDWRQKMRNEGKKCGMKAKNAEWRQKMWNEGKKCGIKAKIVECRQKMWNQGKKMWNVGKKCGIKAKNEEWSQKNAEPRQKMWCHWNVTLFQNWEEIQVHGSISFNSLILLTVHYFFFVHSVGGSPIRKGTAHCSQVVRWRGGRVVKAMDC